jgi:hypothetical protein
MNDFRVEKLEGKSYRHTKKQLAAIISFNYVLLIIIISQHKSYKCSCRIPDGKKFFDSCFKAQTLNTSKG